MFNATTEGFNVRVTPTYLQEQSTPEERRWMWAYTIEIENVGVETAQLKSRHWMIIDANGHIREVDGPGVVGEQPVLYPGDSFTYTSGCPLETSSGFMRGHYEMQSADGRLFRVEIPSFSLDIPHERRTLN